MDFSWMALQTRSATNHKTEAERALQRREEDQMTTKAELGRGNHKPKDAKCTRKGKAPFSPQSTRGQGAFLDILISDF